MLISIRGEPDPELWAAADVLGYELHIRTWGTDEVSVYASGYLVAEGLKWSNREDLVAKLRGIRRFDNIRARG